MDQSFLLYISLCIFYARTPAVVVIVVVVVVVVIVHVPAYLQHPSSSENIVLPKLGRAEWNVG